MDTRGAMIQILKNNLVHSTSQSNDAIWLELYFLRIMLIKITEASAELKSIFTEDFIKQCMKESSDKLFEDMQEANKLALQIEQEKKEDYEQST